MRQTRQIMLGVDAECGEIGCEAKCHARNAQAWAHNHARRTGHVVYFTGEWSVRKCD